MLVTQEALFTESSTGPTGYTASFSLPANAWLTEVRFANVHPWADSGSPLMNGGFNGSASPYWLQAGLKDPTGSCVISDHNDNPSGAAYGAVYGSSRTFTVSVSSNNNDGASGVTRASVTYYVTDVTPVVDVVRS